jgi:hypothetical protein
MTEAERIHQQQWHDQAIARKKAEDERARQPSPQLPLGEC